MIKKLYKVRFKFPTIVLSIMIGALLIMAFETQKGSPKFNSDPAHTVFVPGGSFYMGASDEQIDNSMVNRKKLVSVQSFWMDRTEITNDQYRKFVSYVSDSLKYLAVYLGGINQAEDTIKVDWSRGTETVLSCMAVLYWSPGNSVWVYISLSSI